MYDDLDAAFERMKILMKTADMHELIIRSMGYANVSPFFTLETRPGMKHFYCTDCAKFSVLQYLHPTVSKNSLVSTYNGELCSTMYDTVHPEISVYKDCDMSLSYDINDYLYPNTEENIFQNSVVHDEISAKCIYMLNKLKEYVDSNYNTNEIAVFSVTVFNDSEDVFKWFNEIYKIHDMYKELLCY